MRDVIVNGVIHRLTAIERGTGGCTHCSLLTASDSCHSAVRDNYECFSGISDRSNPLLVYKIVEVEKERN